MIIRTGQGIDFHRLEKGKELWLGGILIPSDKGCVAHSDGDVLIHAICDALLGAAGLRDIGYYFPDTDNEFKDIDSKILLARTLVLIKAKGFNIVNIDTTVCLELPKLSPHIQLIIETLSGVLETDNENISVKATTTEKMGFTGRGEGIIAIASALISKTI